jgi:ATP-binding cassette subfamily B protein
MPDPIPKKFTAQTFRIFWEHAKRYPWSVFALAITLVIVMAAQLYTPFLYKNFFNILSLSNFSSYGLLIKIIYMVLLVNGISWVAMRVNHFTTNYFETNVMTELMNTCFAYLHEHSLSFFSNNFAGSLQRKVNRFSRAFEVISDLLIWDAAPNVLRVIAVVIILMFTYWQVGIIVLIWSIIHTTFNYYFTQYRLRYDLQKSEMDTKMGGYLADTIANNINLKLFTNSELERKSYRGLSGQWHKLAKRSWDLDAISYGIQSMLMVIVEFAVFYVGLHYWRQGLFHVGDFVFIQAYVLTTFNNVWNFSRYLKSFYENMADANEMTEVLLEPHEIKDLPGAKELKVDKGLIEFEDVSYAYNNKRRIYNNFNFKIAAGEKVAVIGPSGGGKSTFIKLLLRFYDLKSGEILIDGQDISKVTQNSLRGNIALVPQEPILFHRSVIENIRYAKPEASDEEVYQAAKLAHAHEFILQLSDGYNTFVGERGIKLSGGERQRVAIARAILKNAPILLLDEATSSLDSESEKLIQDALKNLIQGKTTIVIAHRLSTVMQMDRIIVLEDGKITEQGKHAELLKLEQGTYQRLWNIQAGGFTAAK